MRRFLALSFITALTSCADNRSEPSRLTSQEIYVAVADIQKLAGNGVSVLAVCGPSKGRSWFLKKDEKRFIEDGIGKGLIIFVNKADGRPEIFTRDATNQLVAQSDDGGEIRRLNSQQMNGVIGVWTVSYPSTGVTTSHNLALDDNGILKDIWTQNKPAVSNLPPRASLFISFCEQTLNAQTH